ncbi:MAG TPA: hypothetical protein VMZ91_02215, partial [Candidatus Paceibacterota bacterium]|nr:hypothetical protein [Candidatus Paceibacterota bacterium]
YTFISRFPDGYGVDEAEYRRKKFEDMQQYDKENPVKKNKLQLERDLNVKRFNKYLELHPKATRKELMELFEISNDCISKWKRGDVSDDSREEIKYNDKLFNNSNKEIVVNEEELEKMEKEKGGEYIPNLDKEENESSTICESK